MSPGARYCYTVFSEGPGGLGSATRTALASPPAPVTNVAAVAAPHHITVSWSPSAGAATYVVRAGSACPSTITTGRLVARVAQHPVAVDRHAVPGASYCYSVFALDRNHTHLAAATSNHVIARTAPAPSSAIVSSSLVKAVGVLALGVLLLMAMVFVVARQSTRADWHYGHPPRGGRAAIGGYAGSALVIPVAITVVGLVLVIAAALSI